MLSSSRTPTPPPQDIPIPCACVCVWGGGGEWIFSGTAPIQKHASFPTKIVPLSLKAYATHRLVLWVMMVNLCLIEVHGVSTESKGKA